VLLRPRSVEFKELEIVVPARALGPASTDTSTAAGGD